MSQFLGPVHYRMAEKIRALDARTDLLLSGDRTLHDALGNACGTLAEGPLDEVIDHGNIHGWLQGQVEVAECRHALAVHRLLEAGETVETLKARQISAQDAPRGEDLQQDFFLLDGAFLDGMPCDRAMAVTEKGEGTLCFAISEPAHAAFWTYGTPVSIYEELRFDAMQKQAAAAGMRLTRRAPYEYLLTREG